MIHLVPRKNPCRLYIHLALAYTLCWSLKRSVERTWTGSAVSTNESAWSVMVTGSQSRGGVALTNVVDVLQLGQCPSLTHGSTRLVPCGFLFFLKARKKGRKRDKIGCSTMPRPGLKLWPNQLSCLSKNIWRRELLGPSNIPKIRLRVMGHLIISETRNLGRLIRAAVKIRVDKPISNNLSNFA